jgi:hypothetical protein
MRVRPSQRPFNVAYYARNRVAEIQRVERRQDERVALLRDVRRVPCGECRRSFEPYQMDFDHRDPSIKSFNITQRGLYVSRKRLLVELAKCEIVCANCHRLRTRAQHRARLASTPLRGRGLGIEYQRARWRANAAMLDAMRAAPCADCGDRFPPCAMDFDHPVGVDKIDVVTRLISKSRQRMLAEAAKCDIVCANCHRRRTYVRKLATGRAGVAQLAERQFSKLNVAGSNPVSRSTLLTDH